MRFTFNYACPGCQSRWPITIELPLHGKPVLPPSFDGHVEKDTLDCVEEELEREELQELDATVSKAEDIMARMSTRSLKRMDDQGLALFRNFTPKNPSELKLPDPVRMFNRFVSRYKRHTGSLYCGDPIECDADHIWHVRMMST